jgi:uncharacterized protein with HEPN domain
MRRDDAYLLDILIAARRARRFLEDLTWEEFVDSELHQDAVMRPLAIIGEAARQVSQETRDAHPELPWPQMAGMRNRLIHEYFRVDLATVWETVKNDLPPLIAVLEHLVPPEEEIDD